MVFKLITNRIEISKYQDFLKDELQRRGRQFTGSYGTRGWNPPRTFPAYYLNSWDIYYRYDEKKVSDGRSKAYLNFFGQGKPKMLKDAIQINIIKSGIDRSYKGGFVQSGSSVCILHRGHLGGGRKRHPAAAKPIKLYDLFPKLTDHFDDDGRDSYGVLIPFISSSGKIDAALLPTLKEIVDLICERLPDRVG
ncbi:MAG: hypothetical protein U0805_14920 [Pirellulales bacterium]